MEVEETFKNVRSVSAIVSLLHCRPSSQVRDLHLLLKGNDVFIKTWTTVSSPMPLHHMYGIVFVFIGPSARRNIELLGKVRQAAVLGGLLNN